MELSDKIYIAGHKGMVGSSIVRLLRQKGFQHIITRTSAQLDLKNQDAVNTFFKEESPKYVFLAAAKVGGIMANSSYRGQFIYENIMIQSNVIHSAYVHGVSKLMFLGSSCIYPKMAPQPIKEEYLLTGLLESTNQSYAIAKLAGIEMCDAYRAQYGCNFISVMPANLYGPNDNYDLQTSHVLPAILRKMHEAKISNQPAVDIWGTGEPRREFLHVDDLADACLFLMKGYNESGIVNIGIGTDISIRELAFLLKDIVKYDGNLSFDKTKPDGTMRKLMDITKLNSYGWKAKIGLAEGVRSVYQDGKIFE